MWYLAELKGVLFAGELEVAADEDEHAGVMAIDGGDGVMALMEGEGGELGDNVLWTLNLLTFEGEHGTFLVETCKTATVGVEGCVVVLLVLNGLLLMESTLLEQYCSQKTSLLLAYKFSAWIKWKKFPLLICDIIVNTCKNEW